MSTRMTERDIRALAERLFVGGRPAEVAICLAVRFAVVWEVHRSPDVHPPPTPAPFATTPQE